MSNAGIQTRPASFFDLYAQGSINAEAADDYVAEWHQADPRESAPELHEHLGLRQDEYEVWVMDPDALPVIVQARREALPLDKVIAAYIEQRLRDTPPMDAARATSLRAWLDQQVA